MPARAGWSREQLIIAFKLYCDMPFGKMHSRNPEIIRYARVIGRTPSALAMKLTNIASLDPAIRSTGRTGLRGASQADKEMWDEMTSDWERFAQEITKTERDITSNRILSDSQEEAAVALTSYVGETRSALIAARLGQSFFRSAVLSSYEYRCCISGLAIPELLVASHIVPWRTDKGNRLNPRNGLCLSSIHDRAFDLGLITISPDFRLLVSKRIETTASNSFLCHTFQDYADKPICLPKKFLPDAEFLKFHRENVFVERKRRHEH